MSNPAISLIDATGLASHLEAGDVIVLDARSAAGYWAGHLLGARHVDLSLLALAKTDTASIAQFRARLAWLASVSGLRLDAQLVLHGDALDGHFARLAWALSYAGFERIALFVDGIETVAPQLVTTDVTAVRATHVVLRPRSAMLTSASDIAAEIEEGRSGHLLDARDIGDYLGEKPNPLRRGHIPGARHWNIAHETDASGAFVSPESLHASVLQTGFGPEDAATVYCGSGVRASRTWLALTLSGFEKVAVYPASWQEWGATHSLPLA